MNSMTNAPPSASLLPTTAPPPNLASSSSSSTSTAPQPYSLVWAPIPLISWIWPFVGHLGIARSDGTILDFAVTMRTGDMAFGGPARYLVLRPENAALLKEQVRESAALSARYTTPSAPSQGAKTLAKCWDENLVFSAEVYASRRQYSFLYDNCHNFVAHVLNSIRYQDPLLTTRDWSVVKLAVLLAVRGRFIDTRAALRVIIPSAITLVLLWKVLGLAWLMFFWVGGVVAAVLWFTFFAQCAASGPPSRNMLLSV